MNQRQVRLSFPPHQEGRPYVVRLTHIPTGVTEEAEDADIDTAKAKAAAQLETAVARLESVVAGVVASVGQVA